MQFFLPLMLIIYLQMGGENTKKRKENPPEIRGWTRIIVETDEENPVTVATITADETDVADGYRVRLRGMDVEELKRGLY